MSQTKSPAKPRTILAFDFGTTRIGVAVGQELLGTANSLPPLQARDGIPNKEQLEKLLKEWQPDAFVVGLPLNMDGTESEMSRRARKFGNRLYGQYGKPWFGMDERGTTKQAKQIAKELGHKGSYKKTPVDGIAAQLILEAWFAELQREQPTEV
ncbi:putative holliday junction resolvase [Oceanospirillum multiglobuliferum]|uniref:Putative pre-16S rRNA nuclease n=1 Tax=Oceanospirillum multiglobuliferum TaxID=64969 RepID=A0A1T4RZH9_9GAMM|nr:Holliday junction resolvase RuvX [Oceanospirillum multiglobuliferum]OPX54556.1 Holliday junction resolvase RuvX [Oceanospirillum multiglobuliferum]SKA21420.1 putative holliday junction resolvase [Oceanospirillum multiglobuliferum]